MDLRHDVLPVDNDGGTSRRAQSRVQDRSLFRDVDFVSAKHCLDSFREAGVFGKTDQKIECLARDYVFRIVEVESYGLDSEPLTSFRVICKQGSEMSSTNILIVGAKILPGLTLACSTPVDRFYRFCHSFSFPAIYCVIE